MKSSNLVLELLKEKKISIAELSRRVGQSPQNLGKKLKRDTLTYEELCKIAEVTGTVFSSSFSEPQDAPGIVRDWELALSDLMMKIPGTITLDYDALEDKMIINSCREDGSMNVISVPDFSVSKEIRQWIADGSKDSYKREYDMIMSGKKNSGILELEIIFFGRKTGWYRVFYRVIADENGKVMRIVGRAENVQSYISIASRWRERASQDSLTGLLNHSYIIDAVHNSLSYGKGGTMFMFDIDRFKKLNDTYGHLYGDNVLLEVSEILREIFRNTDLLGRYGGDEFIVFMPGLTDMNIVKQKLHLLLDGVQRIGTGGDDPVTISVGVIINNGEPVSVEELIAKADKALYLSKDNGGNTYSISA